MAVGDERSIKRSVLEEVNRTFVQLLGRVSPLLRRRRFRRPHVAMYRFTPQKRECPLGVISF